MNDSEVDDMEPFSGMALAKVAIPSLLSFVSGLWGDRSQASQAEKARAVQDRQWKEMFDDATQARDEQIIRDIAAEEAAQEKWVAQQHQVEANWNNSVDYNSPYRAASRAILAYSMPGLHVPNFEPSFSTAEGVSPRRNVYTDFGPQNMRSA